MTCLDPSIEDFTTTESGRVKHYVAPRPDVSGHAIVTEAYVFGTPVVALCGTVFVPSRNPDNYPLCQACAEEWDKIEWLNDDDSQ